MTDVSYEPMDIDSSANSCTAMEISYNDIDYEDGIRTTETVVNTTSENSKVNPAIRDRENPYSQRVKKFHIDMAPLRSKGYLFKFSRTYIILFVMSVIVSILSFSVLNVKCYHELELNLLKKALISKVHGQAEAIEDFIRALDINARNKILFLYGGTGVGKTLSISILLDKLLNHTNVHHYTMPSFIDKFSMDLNLGFHFCQSWFIIVDDLNAEDNHITPIINEIIEKSESLRKNLTIILIYNCNNILNNLSTNCDNSFLAKIQHAFINIKAVRKFIKYNPISKDTLKKCIEIELGNSKITNIDIGKVMKNFNVSHDGCKGVYSKVRALKTPT